MSFSFVKRPDTVKVVLQQDTAVNCSDEDYAKYLETLDESLLQLDGIPTYFVLKLSVDYKDHQYLINCQAKLKGRQLVTDMSHVYEEIRVRLVDVENPASVPEEQKIKVTKEKDGYASHDLVKALIEANVLLNLWTAVSIAKSKTDDPMLKKSSKPSPN